MLERTLERVRADLNKEKEDKTAERNRRLKNEKAIADSYKNIDLVFATSQYKLCFCFFLLQNEMLCFHKFQKNKNIFLNALDY